MKIETIPVGEFQVNCYILWSEQGQALIVDPGDDDPRIRNFLKQHNLTVIKYLLTHGHMDHISGLSKMLRDFPAPIALHPADSEWAFTDANQMLPWYTTPDHPGEIACVLEDGEEYTDAGFHYRIIETPGHTPGGVCFYFPEEEVLITGDTLFAGSVGRTDLHGGNSRTLNRSLKQLASLDDDVVLFPGHGPSSTIGREKRTNYFMQFPTQA